MIERAFRFLYPRVPERWRDEREGFEADHIGSAIEVDLGRVVFRWKTGDCLTGRMGGGWDHKLGIIHSAPSEFGGRSFVLYLVFFSISIQPPDDTED